MTFFVWLVLHSNVFLIKEKLHHVAGDDISNQEDRALGMRDRWVNAFESFKRQEIGKVHTGRG